MEKEAIRKSVREQYGTIATKGLTDSKLRGCGCGPPLEKKISSDIGYSSEDLSVIPHEANLGLGCGNPVAVASLEEGETVLDLGSGAGMDCFLAASKVGNTGYVIGVDMTPEMIYKARENARRENAANVEFRLGEIEHLPVQDNSINVVLSNCVINLSPEKEHVFKEIYRVLKPGGRIMISDIVRNRDLPDSITSSLEAYGACIAGAVTKEEYLNIISSRGFKNVRIVEDSAFPSEALLADPTIQAMFFKAGVTVEELQNKERYLSSIKVYAEK